MNKLLSVLIAVYVGIGVVACVGLGVFGDQNIIKEAEVAQTETETAEVDNIRELVDNDTGRNGNDVGTASADAQETAADADTDAEKKSDSDDSDTDETDTEALTAEEEEELAEIEAKLDAYDKAAREEAATEETDSSATDTAKTTTDNTSSTAASSSQSKTTTSTDTDVQYLFTANEGVTLRSEATAESTSLGTVKAGTSGVVLEIVDDYWCKVFVNNQQGYVCSKYITMTSME